MSHPDAAVRHDKSQARYVLEVSGEELGAANYTEQDGKMIFSHTVVDPGLKGQGLGSKLVSEALNDARARGRRIVPVCEFVASYVRNHPDWNDSVDWPQ